MRSAIIYDQPQTCVVQSRAAQDRGQFPNVVDHALIFVRPARFLSSGCQKNSFGPALDLATLPNNLTV
jgi:hypothetical protein